MPFEISLSIGREAQAKGTPCRANEAPLEGIDMIKLIELLLFQ